MSKLALNSVEYETEEDESSDVFDDEQIKNWKENYEEGESESSDEDEVEKKQTKIPIQWSICKCIFVVISRFWLFPVLSYIVIQWISNKP